MIGEKKLMPKAGEKRIAKNRGIINKSVDIPNAKIKITLNLDTLISKYLIHTPFWKNPRTSTH